MPFEKHIQFHTCSKAYLQMFLPKGKGKPNWPDGTLCPKNEAETVSLGGDQPDGHDGFDSDCCSRGVESTVQGKFWIAVDPGQPLIQPASGMVEFTPLVSANDSEFQQYYDDICAIGMEGPGACCAVILVGKPTEFTDKSPVLANAGHDFAASVLLLAGVGTAPSGPGFHFMLKPGTSGYAYEQGWRKGARLTYYTPEGNTKSKFDNVWNKVLGLPTPG